MEALEFLQEHTSTTNLNILDSYFESYIPKITPEHILYRAQQKAFYVPEGLVRTRLKHAFPDCEMYYNIYGDKHCEHATREFDVIVKNQLIGEIKSWINREKLIKDIQRIVTGLKVYNVSTKIPICYFVGAFVIKSIEEINLFEKEIKEVDTLGYSVHLYTIKFTEREWQWITSEQDYIIEISQINSKIFYVQRELKKLFSKIMFDLQSIVSSYACLMYGMQRGLLKGNSTYEEIGEFRRTLPTKEFYVFRFIEQELRKGVWNLAKPLKEELLEEIWIKKYVLFRQHNERALQKRLRYLVVHGKIEKLRKYLIYCLH